MKRCSGFLCCQFVTIGQISLACCPENFCCLDEEMTFVRNGRETNQVKHFLYGSKRYLNFKMIAFMALFGAPYMQVFMYHIGWTKWDVGIRHVACFYFCVFVCVLGADCFYISSCQCMRSVVAVFKKKEKFKALPICAKSLVVWTARLFPVVVFLFGLLSFGLWFAGRRFFFAIWLKL